MPRFLLRSLSALALLLGLLVPTSASAALADDGSDASPEVSVSDSLISPMSISQCPAASICVWESTAYVGSFSATTSYSTTATGLPTGIAHSLMNTSSRAAYVFSGPLGSGTRTCVNPGASTASTSAGAVSFRLSTATSC